MLQRNALASALVKPLHMASQLAKRLAAPFAKARASISPNEASKSKIDAIERDLSMILNDIGGIRPRPFVDRMHMLKYYPDPRSAMSVRQLRVRDKIQETNDAVTIVFEAADNLPITHKPGQFFTFLLTLAGETIKRAYSASSHPRTASNTLSITVKRVNNGLVSNAFHDQVRTGDVLQAIGPSGSFTLRPTSSSSNLLFIAAGSGITPIIPLIEEALSCQPRQVTLIYGNRSIEDIIGLEKLLSLGANHKNFSLHFVLEHQQDCGKIENYLWATPSLLTSEFFLEFLNRKSASFDHAYLCGPSVVRSNAQQVLVQSGMTSVSIHEESYLSPSQRKSSNRKANITHTITIDDGSKLHSVQQKPNETVLDAALQAGVSMPYSCTMGGCGACKVRVKAGNIHNEEPNCLTDDERRRGYVLTCIGEADSDAVIIVENKAL